MQIGKKIKRLRIKKGLTQEELGERTDLSKGFISQLERDLNSPSIETLFSLLEVLGSKPKDFFDDDKNQRVVYLEDEQTVYVDEEKNYQIRWLVPESNDKEMEPVLVTFHDKGEFKQFEPSLSETFMYVIKGKVRLVLGSQEFTAKEGQSLYFEASDQHQLTNNHNQQSEVIIVATHSYL
ncbi:helix-turn-helix domain-containing protein [Paenisporosarcina indica]|uniref:helix-turn-helix domain-containing protein n=1 Tax=Paenisporosarcina indica TaxID=650093 RepID=UPI00094F9050|nr:XRE family transcriptional regulator [Paenisporosarcina indica]